MNPESAESRSDENALRYCTVPGIDPAIDSDFVSISLQADEGAGRNLRIEMRGQTRDTILCRMTLGNVAPESIEPILESASRPLATHSSREQRIHDQLLVLEGLIPHLEAAVGNGASLSCGTGIGPKDIMLKLSEALASSLTKTDYLKFLTVQEVTPELWLVTSRSSYLLGEAFLRLEEHYESPKFRGTAFSHGPFREWYSSQGGGKGFTYHFDWGGYHVPGYATAAMRRGEFDPLTPAEQALLSLIRPRGERFSVIGATEFDQETVNHELAHGLYHVSDAYRAEVNAVLEKYDISPVTAWLAESGYCEAVFLDEAHAYLNDSEEDMLNNGYSTPELREARKELQAIFKRYTPGLPV